VIFGTQTTMALFDRPDHDVLSGRAQSTAYSIEYPVERSRWSRARRCRPDRDYARLEVGFDRKAAAVHRMLSQSRPFQRQFKVISPPDSLTMERSRALIWRSCEFGT
jgi:hypothetical protein